MFEKYTNYVIGTCFCSHAQLFQITYSTAHCIENITTYQNPNSHFFFDFCHLVLNAPLKSDRRNRRTPPAYAGMNRAPTVSADESSATTVTWFYYRHLVEFIHYCKNGCRYHVGPPKMRARKGHRTGQELRRITKRSISIHRLHERCCYSCCCCC